MCDQTGCISANSEERTYLDQVDESNQKYRQDGKVLNYDLSDIWLQSKEPHKFDKFDEVCTDLTQGKQAPHNVYYCIDDLIGPCLYEHQNRDFSKNLRKQSFMGCINY